MSSAPLAIVAALDDEIRILKSKLSVDVRLHHRPLLVIRGTYDHIPVVVIRTGVGRLAMARAMEECLAREAPAALLHVGYCGASMPSLSPGDLVIAGEAVDAQSGERHPVDGGLHARGKALAARLGLRFREGALVTVDAVAATPHEKGALGAEHGALGIDMESADCAAAAIRRGIPFAIVRAVLDPLEAAVPDLSGALDAEGEASALAVASHLVRRPADAAPVARLYSYALQARQSLNVFIDAWLREDRP